MNAFEGWKTTFFTCDPLSDFIDLKIRIVKLTGLNPTRETHANYMLFNDGSVFHNGKTYHPLRTRGSIYVRPDMIFFDEFDGFKFFKKFDAYEKMYWKIYGIDVFRTKTYANIYETVNEYSLVCNQTFQKLLDSEQILGLVRSMKKV